MALLHAVGSAIAATVEFFVI